MILRLSTAAERAALIFVAFSLALFLAYFSIRNARAVYSVDLQTLQGLDRATHLEPGNAYNWYLLGRFWQYNLEDSDNRKAIAAYRTALSLDPHSAETWLDLGAALEAEGDLPAARDAFVRAKADYPLSADVSWRYGNFLLRRQEVDSAFAEIRRSVQADPRRGGEAFSRCFRILPDVHQILDRVLPPSPNIYLDVLLNLARDGEIGSALKVWDRLIALHPQMPLSQTSPFIDVLRQGGQIAEARRAWDQAATFAGLSALPGPADSVLWDGSFESGVTHGGYAWTFPENSHSVDIRIDPQEHHSGNNALRLTFDGKSNLAFMDVCHLVPVHPSTSYRFSAWILARGLTTDQGVRFQLHSLGISDSSVVVTSEVHGTTPWTSVDLPWISGPDVQEMQVCVARNLSDQADNKIQGVAWIDDVALIPVPQGNSRP